MKGDDKNKLLRSQSTGHMSLLLSREARELAIFLEEKWLQNLFGKVESLGTSKEISEPERDLVSIESFSVLKLMLMKGRMETVRVDDSRTIWHLAWNRIGF